MNPFFAKAPIPSLETMKPRPEYRGWLRPALCLALTAVAFAFGSTDALAQATPNPPERLTYQGFLVDGNGVALGNAAPKNYDVIFRIYTDQSAGSMLWAEQQTVTVDKGYFSVLLGEGASTGEPRPGLSTVFTGPTASDRFVGITVKGIGSGGANVDISPRLRLLSSPYAFLAQQAVKIVRPDNGNDLITASGNGVTVSGSVAAANITASGNISGVTVSGTTLSGDGANITGINANNITLGTIPNGRTSATSANVPNTIVARDGAGTISVGNLFSAGLIGAPALQANNGVTSHSQGAYLEWNKGNGDGMTYLLNQRGGGAGGISFGEVSTGNAVTEGMRLTAAGNLGIGTGSPGLRLDVAGAVGISGANVLEFGRGVSKEGSAGRIGYQTFTAGALDIVGAGTTGSNRKIKLWSEGGLDLNGPLNVSYPAVIPFAVYGNYGLTMRVGNSEIQGFHATDKNKYFSIFRYDRGVEIFAGGGGFGNNGNSTSAITWDGDGNWDFASDRKLKKDIVDAETMLDRALQVQVRRFRWKDSADDSKLSLGVIAQELQPLFPDLVSTQENPETKETNLAVGYSDFGLIAVKAIQELKTQQDKEISDLKAQMAELKAQMTEVLRVNAALQSQSDKKPLTAAAGQ
jgi:hypothetical protein